MARERKVNTITVDNPMAKRGKWRHVFHRLIVEKNIYIQYKYTVHIVE